MHQGPHGIGHRHERDLRVGPHEARVGLALRRRMEHLGAVVARAAHGHGVGRDDPREANRPEVHARRATVGIEQSVVPHVVAAHLLDGTLVQAVHRDGIAALILAHDPGRDLGRERFDAICRNRAREHEGHVVATPSRRFGGELEQRAAAHDVDRECELGIALPARGEQRRKVPDLADVMLGRQGLHELGIGDASAIGVGRCGGRLAVQFAEVDRHDLTLSAPLPVQLLEERVAHLATSASDEDRTGRGGAARG